AFRKRPSLRTRKTKRRLPSRISIFSRASTDDLHSLKTDSIPLDRTKRRSETIERLSARLARFLKFGVVVLQAGEAGVSLAVILGVDVDGAAEQAVGFFPFVLLPAGHRQSPERCPGLGMFFPALLLIDRQSLPAECFRLRKLLQIDA